MEAGDAMGYSLRWRFGTRSSLRVPGNILKNVAFGDRHGIKDLGTGWLD
jgi:hypothetical protein